tara:strand:- start:6160 stop:7311 length:1152 start_codon:yes stop_codon:yes gene_type:complete
MFSSAVSAQDDFGKYRFTPAPDIWYNTVDGVRIGIRILGEQEGSFKDGPHRLDAGLWLGTNIPENPVSYYLSLTEPIKSISDFGEEGSFQVISSIRTGFSQHKLLLNKRWQDGFNELLYKEVSISFSQQKMFAAEYRPYPIQWSTNWKSLVGINFMTHNESEDNLFEAIFNVQQNINPESESFTSLDVEVWDVYPINDKFGLGFRLFGGFTSENADPEYLYTASYAKPIDWLGNGVSRAKGTIPTAWLNNGLAHVSGSANLRGYTDTQYSNLTLGGFNSVAALNLEFEFPNPYSLSNKDGILGEFLFLKSYLFVDAGTVFEDTPMLFDAGVGLQFSLNIPDFLGKPRGFAVRYEVPFWISNPNDGNSNFEFRNLIGFGAVISL